MKAAGILGIAGGVITLINPPVGALVLAAASVTWVATSDDDRPSEHPEPKVVPKLSPPPLDFSSLGIPEIKPINLPSLSPRPDFSFPLVRHDDGIGQDFANRWFAQPGNTSRLDIEITHDLIQDGEVVKSVVSRRSFTR